MVDVGRSEPFKDFIFSSASASAIVESSFEYDTCNKSMNAAYALNMHTEIYKLSLFFKATVVVMFH